MHNDIQQINLYLPELRPRKDLVTVGRLVQATVFTLLVMLLLTATSLWQRSAQRTELAGLQALVAQQTILTEQTERDLASRATDQALVREMNEAERRLAQAQELYAFMSTTSPGNLSGFSSHLMDFSRASFPGLWITQFQIRGNAEFVSLTGSAEQAAMLPDYVSRLAMGQSEIRNKRFSRLSTTRVQAASGDSYQFMLESN